LRVLGKVILGILSIEPIIFFALFFGWLLPSFMAPRHGTEPSLFHERLEALMPLAKTSLLFIIVLIVVYAIALSRRADLQVGEKVGVPVVILFSNGLALPFVWWLYVWRESNLGNISRRPAPPN